MNAKDIPNLITAFRILLVPPVVFFLVDGKYVEALSLFVLAGVSDGVDGYLARRFGWRSRLGSILDPLADKLLVISVFVTLGWVGAVPVWLVMAVLVRDIVIVLGAVTYHFFVGQYSMAPTFISKLNTTVQILLIMELMLSQVWALPELLTTSLIYTLLGTLVLSGLDYVWVWGKKAIRAGRDIKAHQ